MSNETSSFEKITLLGRKYLLPIFFVIIAGLLVYFAFATRKGEYNKKVDGTIVVTTLENTSAMGADRIPGPNQAMIIGAVACLLAALIAVAFVSGKVKKSIGTVIALLCIPAVGFICYKIWDSIDSHQKLAEQRELYKDEIRMRLMDIRTAQEAYKREHGHFVKDLNVLIDFIENGKMSEVQKFGSVPSRTITEAERDFIYGNNQAIDKKMTEEEALALLKMDPVPADLATFKRDTVYVPVKNKIFLTAAKIDYRKKASIYPEFNADSIKYIPFTGGEEFPVQFDTVFQPMKASVFKIEVLHPFLERFDDTLRIGNLEKIDLSGNWEQ